MANNSRELRRKVREDLKRDAKSHGGVITEYLSHIRGHDPKGADGLEADIVETFMSDCGLRVLKLLEKAVQESALPLGSDDRALRENNAMRNLVIEIRRYVANGG